MDTIWLILFIIFLVLRKSGKLNQPVRKPGTKKPEGGQLLQELRRLQEQYFPEQPQLPPVSPGPLPGWLVQETAAGETDIIGAEAVDGRWELEPLDTMPALEMLPEEAVVMPIPKHAARPAAPPPETAAEDAAFILHWQGNSLLQGVIMAEILQSPGGKSRGQLRRK